MKRLDPLTPIGIIFGITVLLLAIFSNAGLSGFLTFIDVAALLIVGGGVAADILITFNFKDLKLIPKVIKETMLAKDHDLEELIQTFVKLSEKARREGLLSLEAALDDIDDPFIKKGILLAVDGIEQDVIKDIMMAEVVAMEERHRKGRIILEKAGEYAPAWGMIGTLVGLVLMLKNLNEPESLGPNMAVAIITTFYGVVLANLVFLPMATKLENKTEEEVFVKQVIIEGVLGVQSGQNPKVLEEKLSAFVIEKKKKSDDLGDRHVAS